MRTWENAAWGGGWMRAEWPDATGALDGWMREGQDDDDQVDID